MPRSVPAPGAVAAKVVDLGIPDEWVSWFRQAGEPGRSTVALLVANLDHNALVAETSRFTGAQLVYANLDDLTIDRIREALGQLPIDHDHRTTIAVPGMDTPNPRRLTAHPDISFSQSNVGQLHV